MVDDALPLVIQPIDLMDAMEERDDLLIVDLSSPDLYADGHLPGAVHLEYGHLIRQAPPAMGLLADTEKLSAALSAIGLSDDKHVVAYDAEGNGRASRLIWTLDVLGHDRKSLLNGGLAAWVAEDGDISREPATAPSSQYTAEIRRPEALADKDYILANLDNPKLRVLDARTVGEFHGTDLRAARGGHIPGAKNLDWKQTMDPDHEYRFKPASALKAMLAERDIAPEHEVIVHCQTHHRSAHTYVMLKQLGYENVRGYDGSWSEWGNLADTPVEASE